MIRKPEPELMDLPHEVRAYVEADFREVNQRFAEHVATLAAKRVPQLTASARALDLGCGPGDITARVARLRPGWQITAADASQPMLDLAAALFASSAMADRVKTKLTDAKKMDFADFSFDVVFSNSLLHHLPDPVPMWRELARITRPGGLIVFRDLYRPASPEVAQQLVDLHVAGQSPTLVEEFHRSLFAAFSVGEVKAQLETAGLRDFAVAEINDRHVDVIGFAPV